jgi:small-conductance mechanosensitive channel
MTFVLKFKYLIFLYLFLYEFAGFYHFIKLIMLKLYYFQFVSSLEYAFKVNHLNIFIMNLIIIIIFIVINLLAFLSCFEGCIENSCKKLNVFLVEFM